MADKCIECEKDLKTVTKFIMDMFDPPDSYCENKECSRYGLVTALGIRGNGHKTEIRRKINRNHLKVEK